MCSRNIRSSQKKGKHYIIHKQYDTIRNIRTLHYNMYEFSSQTFERRGVLRDLRGKVTQFSNCPTQSILSTRSSKSLSENIGREIKSDRLNISLMSKTLSKNC